MPKAPDRRKDQSGVAAIEFALVLPVLLLLFFGMVNLAHYASVKRKLTNAAELVADLITRQPTTISSALIDDYFKAVELSLSPMAASTVRKVVGIDVYGYRLVKAEPKVAWRKFYGGAARCPAPAVTTDPSDPIGSLLSGSDVVVAVVCMTYTAPVASYPGLGFLADHPIKKQFALRPRQTTTLDCIPKDCS